MSTAAIDTNRTNERLSAFLSDIATKDPVDNYFPKFTLLDKLMNNKKTGTFGRQVLIPIDSGFNGTVQTFSGYDTFSTAAQDTALTLVYPMVNRGGTLVISWEEEREVGDDAHRIIDLLAHKRKNLIKSTMDQYSQAVFAAAQSAADVTSLAVAIDSTTGSPGNLTAATDADWASYETASGSFATQGLTDMRTLYNNIMINGATPDTVVMNQTIYEYYENEIDPDVRYSKAQDVGGRGFKTLEFKGIPITPELRATAQTIFMWDSENVKVYVDSAGNYAFSDFEAPTNQWARVAKLACRMQVIIDRRKSTGKLTGVTA